MSVIAKFRVDSAEPTPGYSYITVRLSAVTTGPGNESWAKFTPAGNMMLLIDNPAASDQLKPGTVWHITFDEVK